MIAFDNSFAREMEGFYVPAQSAVPPQPSMFKANLDLGQAFGLSEKWLQSDDALAIFSGQKLPDESDPLAQAYAGHQYAHFQPQLGDGRALLVGELLDQQGRRFDLQLKGSGPTAFSRGGDGKSALGPVLREYIMGEAMYAMGIPTTRALAAVLTGEQIMREESRPGAVLARIASSHIRIGTFQFFAARGEIDRLRQLADYVIARHYPDVVETEHRFSALLDAIVERQLSLVAQWMGVGFVHGVMNTDNIAVSGETLDYGPCAFIDSYDPKSVYSSIDRYGRYAYGEQPSIMQWNLARLAECILPLMADELGDEAAAHAKASDMIVQIPQRYEAKWQRELAAKLGINSETPNAAGLMEEALQFIEELKLDFTLFFRHLMFALDDTRFKSIGGHFDDPHVGAFVEKLKVEWAHDGVAQQARVEQMVRVNPIYIPRNHLLEEAVDAAEAGNASSFLRLLDIVREPFEQRAEVPLAYTQPAPEGLAPHITYCGT